MVVSSMVTTVGRPRSRTLAEPILIGWSGGTGFISIVTRMTWKIMNSATMIKKITIALSALSMLLKRRKVTPS